MVLLPGSNYNHTYWDFPYVPQTYNFRRAMNAAGYATLVVDRLGIGASSRPPSMLVTATGSAQALHEIVQALRRGLAGAQPFAKVIIGGHSLSSGIDVLEASTYHDVDGVFADRVLPRPERSRGPRRDGHLPASHPGPSIRREGIRSGLSSDAARNSRPRFPCAR
ncbi:alpha/beta fold hydrolase [Nocardia sp. NPDC049190]|uniref:alpha/beta fold hydrolase n=1 Tax=Nocardia sp. NPDC049190 TaxID=3155650 RepID=UPI0033E51A2E